MQCGKKNFKRACMWPNILNNKASRFARLVFLHAKTHIRLYAKPAVIPLKISNNCSLHEVFPLVDSKWRTNYVYDFTRITIKYNRNQNFGESKGKRRDLSLRDVFMQESQLDKVLRQTFLLVKVGRRGRIQNLVSRWTVAGNVCKLRRNLLVILQYTNGKTFYTSVYLSTSHKKLQK